VKKPATENHERPRPPRPDRAILVWNGRVARPEPAELEAPAEEDRQSAFWTLPAFRQRVQT
jgi:hypothetical protein